MFDCHNSLLEIWDQIASSALLIWRWRQELLRWLRRGTTESIAPFAISTTWTAPTQCAQSVGGMTMLENDQYRVWLSPILPVPGATVSSCYPSQYVSSFLLRIGGTSQAAMSLLVCPAGYITQGPFTSDYIACCPR